MNISLRNRKSITKNTLKSLFQISNFHFNTNPFIFSIDQGTTSTRLALIDRSLNITDISQKEHQQIHKNISWTEHNPIELKENIEFLIKDLHNKNPNVKF